MAGPSIPASAIVAVTPGVQGAGGSAIDLTGVVLTTNLRVPANSALQFPNALSVQTYFGATAIESQMAVTYFGGSVNSTKKPGNMIFYQSSLTAGSAFERGANIGTTPLATLTSGTGPYNQMIDGANFAVSTLNLNSATSLAAIATLLQTALGNAAPVVTTFSGSISGTTLTVSTVASGTVAIGQTITGTNVAAGTSITGMQSGSGGSGTYTVSSSQTVASTTISGSAAAPSVSYDVISGGLVVTSGTTGISSSILPATGPSAVKLGLSATSNPVLSPGTASSTNGQQLTNLLQVVTDWAFVTTAFEPTLAGKLTIAAWVSGSSNDYGYVCWDTLSTGAVNSGDTTSAAYAIIQAGYSSTIPVYAPINGALAGAAVLGQLASIDFSAKNGRTTSAFEYPAAGLLGPDVTNAVSAANLRANGYNYFGSYGTGNAQFQFFYPGSITGSYLWIDSFANQVWGTNLLQLALMQLLTSVKSIPYNAVGYAMIEEAVRQPALQMVNFGMARTGVTIGLQEAAAINANAGNINVTATLFTQGFYIQILDPGPTARVARQSPSCTFWYVDGQSIQSINLAAIDVQ